MARRSKHSNRSSRSERRYRSTKRKLRRITSKLDTLTQLMLKQSQPAQTTTQTEKVVPMQQSLTNLTEVTTPRQVKNGTRAFLCNCTGAIYTSHSNGYVRRQLHPSCRGSKGSSGQYQINTRKNGVDIMIPNESDRLSRS